MVFRNEAAFGFAFGEDLGLTLVVSTISSPSGRGSRSASEVCSGPTANNAKRSSTWGQDVFATGVSPSSAVTAMASTVPVSSYAPSVPSSNATLSTGQNHNAHQASITVFSRQ